MRAVFEHRGEIEVETDDEGKLVALKVYGVQRKVPLPEAVVNVEVTEITNAKVSLRWSDRGDAKSWNVYRYKVADGGPGSLIGSTPIPSFSDETVEGDAEYVFEIEAVNTAGASLDREAVSVTTADAATPDAPTDFETIAITATRIHFSWSTQEGVVEWKVYESDLLVATVSVPEHEAIGLTPSTEYTFHVIASNSAGDSDPSADYVQTTAANSAPVWAPIDTQTGNVGDGYSLDLSQFCIDPDGQNVTFAILDNDVTGIGLAPDGKTLVGTFGAAGTGAISVRASDGLATADVAINFEIAAIADTTPPTAPVLGTPLVGGSTVTLPLVAASTDASGIERYTVSRRGPGESGFSIRAVFNSASGFPTPEDGFPYVESGLPDGTYEYRCAARDASPANNVSAFSGIVSAAVAVAPTVPDAPINFTANAINSTSIQLTWGPGPSGATPDDYDADYSTSGSSGPWTPLAVGLQTSFTHTGRTPGQHVDYRLKAKSGTEESGYVTAFATPPASATRVTYIESTFDSNFMEDQPTARSQESRRKGNGMRVQAVERNQGSGFGFLSSSNVGSQCSGENSDYDVRIVPSISITGNGLTDSVEPRAGARFLHTQCFRGRNPIDGNTMGGTTKHYEQLQGGSATHNSTICKPRTAFAWSNVVAYGIPYDTRFFVGLSIYIPRSYENETNRKGITGNGPQILPLNIPNDIDSTQFSLQFLVPTPAQNWRLPNGNLVASGLTDTYWCLIWERNTTTHKQGSQGGTGQTTKIALAPFLPHTNPDSDRGKWTDLVMEICLNPFTSATTVSGWNFRANTGRFRLWKSSGPVDVNGNRAINESQPLYSVTSGGFGLRPKNSTDMGVFQWRQYCFCVRGEVATSRTHPIELGFDEMRLGFAENRSHANSGDSNLVTQWQGGVASTFADVLPRS